jgi:hypothetical protein
MGPPDPAGLAAVNPTNPQSWNRYSYVLNNPLALVDPSGLCPGGLAEYRYTGDSEQRSSGGGPSMADFEAEPAPQFSSSCPGFTDQGGGGGVFVDGVNLTGIPGLVGGSDSNAVCPNGNCGIFNLAQTGANGHQYWIWPSIDGYTYVNASNGDEVENSE